MYPLTKLFVASDFSAPARHAVMRSADLAQQLNAELCIAHVLTPSIHEQWQQLLHIDTQEAEQRLHTQAQLQLNALMVSVQEQTQITPQLALHNGAILPTLMHSIQTYQADLVVLAAKGESFMRHWALGSTAERLIRLLETPLLVVKQSPQIHYHRVMVAVDFSAWSIAAIHLARTLAPHAHLVLAHVFDIPEEGKLKMAGVDEVTIYRYRNDLIQQQHHKLNQLAEQAGLAIQQWSPLVMKGNAAYRLLEAEESQDIDLIVLGKHGHGWFKEMLIGSTTKQLLAEARVDVLVTQRAPENSVHQ